MKKILMIVLCLAIAGCASVSKVKTMQGEISQLQENLSNKESEIKKLQEQLVEKDTKIKDLNSKLEGFGVFKVEKKEGEPVEIKEEVKPEAEEVAPVK